MRGKAVATRLLRPGGDALASRNERAEGYSWLQRATQDPTKRCAAKSLIEGLVNLAGSDAARGGCSEEQLPLAAD